MNKLDTIRINGVSYEIGGASDETVQALDTRLSNIESIIGDPNSADNDDVINKAVEVIDFFSNVPETDTLSGTLSNINNKFGNLGNKTEQLTYTAEEAAAYNTEHELQQGDDGYVTEGDVKTPAVPNTVKDVLDTKANKSEMSVEAGTGNDADKTTITLKTGTSATVLTSHQSLNNYYTKSECEAIFSTASTYVPTLSAAPTSSTLSYTKDEVSHDFEIGDFCRVEDEPTEGEYTFYQLYDIDQTNGATWGKLSDDVINWITLDSQGNIVSYQRTVGGESQSDTNTIMEIYKQAIIGNLGNKTEAVPAVYEAVTDGTTLTEGDTYYTSSTGEGEFTSDGTEVADGTNYYVLVSAAVPAVPYDIKSYVDDGLATKVALSSTTGLLKNDGSVDTNTYLTSHQDISGKADKVNITAGTYKSVTVNSDGIVTAGSNPTTLSGYGITDASLSNNTITLGSSTFDLDTKEDKLAIYICNPAWLTISPAIVGVYYIWTAAITASSLTITLQVPSDISHTLKCKFYIMTGSNPNISFTSTVPIDFDSGSSFLLNRNSNVEVTATFIRDRWFITTTVKYPYTGTVRYLLNTSAGEFISLDYVPSGEDVEIGGTFLVIDWGTGQYVSIVGSYGGEDKNTWRIIRNDRRNDSIFVYNASIAGGGGVVVPFTVNVIYDFILTHNNIVILGNAINFTKSYNSAKDTDASIALFDYSRLYNNNLDEDLSYNSQIVRWYSFYIKKAGVLVRDCIPVVKNGVGYMYDKVTGNLYGNGANVGGFIIGY